MYTYPETIADDSFSVSTDPVFQNLTTAQNFLHGSDLTFDCRRFHIKGLDLKFTESALTETAILLTFYPEFDTATLMLCFPWKMPPQMRWYIIVRYLPAAEHFVHHQA